MLKVKGNKGITLIALIVTIVVLLILAGVTINTITGSESSMEKATQAREENNIANELEQIKLSITNAMAQGFDGKVSDVNLKNALQGIIDDEELENITGAGPWTITTKLKKTYEINGYGQIEPAATPTDIYVALDGTTLRFYNQKDNVSGTLYMNNNEPYNLKGVDFTDYSQIPWNNVKTSIKRVSFEEVIVPTSTARWFNECGITGIDHIERLNTRYITNMAYMFRNCESLENLDVSKFDTRNVTNMRVMFQRCIKLKNLDVSKFNTSKVTDMEYMFFGDSNLTELDLSKWNTSFVVNMGSMFYECSNLTTIYVGDKWNTDKVTESTNMFAQCAKLKGQKGTTCTSPLDKTIAHIDEGTENPGVFTDISKKELVEIGDYIKYGVGYTDMYNTTQIFQPNDGKGWRILNPGTKNSEGKYEGVKIISTGSPASLNVYSSDANSNTWWGSDTKNRTMYKAAEGLANDSLFKNISLEGTGNNDSTGWNKGKKINIANENSNMDVSTCSIFLTDNALGVHNLKLDEINIAINTLNEKSVNDEGYRIPETSIDYIYEELFKTPGTTWISSAVRFK